VQCFDIIYLAVYYIFYGVFVIIINNMMSSYLNNKFNYLLIKLVRDDFEKILTGEKYKYKFIIQHDL
jgi:hypothetical protein